MQWTVQLRDEKGQAHSLDLVSGGETTVRNLKRLVNKVGPEMHNQILNWSLANFSFPSQTCISR
jgi:hypothetical protein